MAENYCKHEWRPTVVGAVCKHCDYLRPDATPADNHRATLDNVLIRHINLGMAGKLAMPDKAIEGKVNVVISIGENVTIKDLKIGDTVLCTGNLESETYLLPGCSDLVVATQKNIRVVLGHVDEKPIYHTDKDIKAKKRIIT